MKTYEEKMEAIKNVSVNYFENKNAIDFFIDMHGIDTYLNFCKYLFNKKINNDINNVIKLNMINCNLSQIIKYYLFLEEKYIKSYLFRNHYAKSLNSLNEKHLKSLLMFIKENKNLIEELNIKEISIQDITELINKSNDYQIIFLKNLKQKIESLINILPECYKDNFFNELETINKMYMDLKKV